MRALLFTLLCLSWAAAAAAQTKDRIPPFVADVRGVFGMLKTDTATADTLHITGEDLPGHGIGLMGGLHFYPLRRGGFAFGVGGEFLTIGAGGQRTDDTGVVVGPDVRRQLRSVSGQLSFNFGHRTGWSYITAGIGPVGFDTYIAAPPPATPTEPDGLRPMTQNFGFGARWFNGKHLAFELDLRFYLTVPANPTTIVGGRARTNVTVMSAGIGLK